MGSQFFLRADGKEGVMIFVLLQEKKDEAQLQEQEQPSLTLPCASGECTAERRVTDQQHPHSRVSVVT